MAEQINSDNILSVIRNLTSEERIMIPIHDDWAREMRFAYFKRQGLENMMLSYINNTTEHANEMNLEKFTERVAMTYIEERDTLKKIGMTVLGKELYEYLVDSDIPQSFSVDFDRALLIIHPAEAIPTNYISECGCGSASCRIDNH